MKPITKAAVLFFISLSIILMLPYVSHAESWAWYNITNVSYPAYGVECGTGGLYPGKEIWWCWTNYTNKTMAKSFMNYSDMEAYYNPGDGLIIGGDTYSLSAAYQEHAITIEKEQGMLSGMFAFIQGILSL